MSGTTKEAAQGRGATGAEVQGTAPAVDQNYRAGTAIAGGGQGLRPAWLQALDDAYSKHEPDLPSDEEIDRLIGEIEGRFDSEQVAALLETCRDSVVQNIVEPFGLRGVFANRDKHGGRVLTQHNATEKFTGRDSEIHVPEDARYKSSKQDYGLKKKVREQMLAEKALGRGEVKDDYTGTAIPANKSDVDHVVSKKEFHYAEGGFMLDEDRQKAFANDRDNLAVTDQSRNRSKGSESIPDAKERRPEIDRRRTRHTEERARETVSRHRPSAAQAARYYGKKVAPEAVGSGLRFGMRQALGLCLHELTIGIFDEVTDICRNGLRADETSYAHAVEKRVAEIWRRVKEKWRDMLSAFRDGFIVGALSEVVTLLVNLFYTTSKRVVRIIREGALSFLRALKMIFVLPEGMTRAETLDAATKAMAGAVLTVCGIALEEGIERALGALPFAELVVPVVLGMLVGLATAVVVFCLDRLDMFGVQANRRREFLFSELDARVEEALWGSRVRLRGGERHTVARTALAGARWRRGPSLADGDEAVGAVSAFGALLATRVETAMRAYVHEVEGRIERIRLDSVIREGGYNDLAVLPEGPGVYAFCRANEFLYVGQSPTQGIRVRVGQHLARRDQGGTLRLHWCQLHCQDGACGERKACKGSAFQRYQTWLSRHCEVWTITAAGLADESKAGRLEDMLISATQPTFQHLSDPSR